MAHVRTVSSRYAAAAPKIRFGAHAASIGSITPLAQSREDADHRPVDQREDDADADAVHRAAPAGGDRERHGDQRHHQRHERERDLAVQPDLVVEHVVAARAQLVDVGAQLRKFISSGSRASVTK